MSNPRELRTLVDAIAYIVVLRREIKKLRRMNTRLVKAKGVCPATQPPYQQSIDRHSYFTLAKNIRKHHWRY